MGQITKKPEKSGLLAKFKNKSGLKKLGPFSENGPFWVFFGPFWSICADLKKYSDEKPTCPLLFSINCDKKIKDIYRYGQNKWAFGHKPKNSHSHKVLTQSQPRENNIPFYEERRIKRDRRLLSLFRLLKKQERRPAYGQWF